ncbi:MAG: asparaginase [Pigmentiphaga sp.]
MLPNRTGDGTLRGMTLPRIAIAALGGTICMTPSAEGGVMPKLDAADLVAAVPELEQIGSLHAETLFNLPSSALDFGILRHVLDWAGHQVEQGAEGVVITQGTDSLEESAFFLDLYWQHPQPLVLTGAMRNPGMAGADGPANLLAAAIAAASPSAWGRGVLAVLNDTAHAARRVRKSHTLAPDAFRSPNGGPLGTLVEGRWHWFSSAERRAEPLAPAFITPHVALLETCLGDTGELLDGVLAAKFDGLVLSGFGTGHVSPAFAERLGPVCRRMPVVMASRTGAGHTTQATYGALGSEIDLRKRGVWMAADLDARKARLLLWGLLAAGTPPERLGEAWAAWLQGAPSQ